MPIIEKIEEFANRKYKRPGEIDLKEIFGSQQKILIHHLK